MRWFAGLSCFGLALAVLHAFAIAANPDARAELSADGLLAPALAIAFILLFLWLIAYRASNIARWVFLGLVAIGMLGLVADFRLVADLRPLRDDRDLSQALAVAQYLLCLIESGLLFLPDARDWFAGRAPLDP